MGFDPVTTDDDTLQGQAAPDSGAASPVGTFTPVSKNVGTFTPLNPAKQITGLKINGQPATPAQLQDALKQKQELQSGLEQGIGQSLTQAVEGSQPPSSAPALPTARASATPPPNLASMTPDEIEAARQARERIATPVAPIDRQIAEYERQQMNQGGATPDELAQQRSLDQRLKEDQTGSLAEQVKQANPLRLITNPDENITGSAIRTAARAMTSNVPAIDFNPTKRSGALGAIENAASGMTSPAMIGTLGFWRFLPEFAQRAVLGGTAVGSTKGIGESLADAADAAKNNDIEAAAKHVTDATINTLWAGLTGSAALHNANPFQKQMQIQAGYDYLVANGFTDEQAGTLFERVSEEVKNGRPEVAMSLLAGAKGMADANAAAPRAIKRVQPTDAGPGTPASPPTAAPAEHPIDVAVRQITDGLQDMARIVKGEKSGVRSQESGQQPGMGGQNEASQNTPATGEPAAGLAAQGAGGQQVAAGLGGIAPQAAGRPINPPVITSPPNIQPGAVAGAGGGNTGHFTPVGQTVDSGQGTVRQPQQAEGINAEGIGGQTETPGAPQTPQGQAGGGVRIRNDAQNGLETQPGAETRVPGVGLSREDVLAELGPDAPEPVIKYWQEHGAEHRQLQAAHDKLIATPAEDRNETTLRNIARIRQRMSAIEDGMPLEDLKPIAYGQPFTVKTPIEGTPARGRYALLDASRLVTSYDPGYDPQLQPRDRSRQASKEQISQIATKLDPERLADSVTSDLGAPMVDSQGQVLSGNGRTASIRQAYTADTPAARQYKSWLADNAQRFGLTREAVESASRPVLVRHVEDYGEISKQEFSRQSNQQQVAGMSEAKKAGADARWINENPQWLDGLQVGETGTIDQQSRQLFIAGTGRGAEMMGKQGVDGRLADPVIKRAVVAVLVGPENRHEVNAMTEGADALGIRNVSNGLIQVAPKLLKLRGTPYDLSDLLSSSVHNLVKLKTDGWPLEKFLGQEQLFTDPTRTAESDFLLGHLANANSAKAIADPLGRYYELASHIDLTTSGLPGLGSSLVEIPSRKDILNRAYESVTQTGQAAVAARPPSRGRTPGLGAPEDNAVRESAAVYGGQGAAKSPDEIARRSFSPEELRVPGEHWAKILNLPGALTAVDTPAIVELRRRQNSLPETIDDQSNAQKLKRLKAEKFLYGNGAASRKRVAHIVMGLPASGKSQFFVEAIKRAHGSLVLDSDIIKSMLARKGEERFYDCTHADSTQVWGKVLKKAIKAGDNLVLPIIGRNLKQVQRYIGRLKKNGYKVHLIHADISPEESARRIASRNTEHTERFVDPAKALEYGLTPRENYEILKRDERLTTAEAYNADVPKGQFPTPATNIGGNTGRNKEGGREGGSGDRPDVRRVGEGRRAEGPATGEVRERPEPRRELALGDTNYKLITDEVVDHERIQRQKEAAEQRRRDLEAGHKFLFEPKRAYAAAVRYLKSVGVTGAVNLNAASKSITQALQVIGERRLAETDPNQQLLYFTLPKPAQVSAPGPITASMEDEAKGMGGDLAALGRTLASKGRASSIISKLISREIPVLDLRGLKIEAPVDVYAALYPIRTPFFESLKLLVLSDDNVVVHSQIVSVGTINSSLVSPSMITSVLVKVNEASGKKYNRVIMAHNHPSGDPTPSNEDVRISRKCEETAKVAGFVVVDHVVTNGEKYCSLKELGLMSVGSGTLPRGSKAPKSLVREGAAGGKAPWELVKRSELLDITEPEYAARIIKPLRSQDPGSGHVLYLTTKNYLTAIERISDFATRPLEEIWQLIARGAAREGAAAVIIDGTPTTMDVGYASRMQAFAKRADVELLDIVAVTDEARGYKSLKEIGFMESPAQYGAGRSDAVREEGVIYGAQALAEVKSDIFRIQQELNRNPAPYRRKMLEKRLEGAKTLEQSLGRMRDEGGRMKGGVRRQGSEGVQRPTAGGQTPNVTGGAGGPPKPPVTQDFFEDPELPKKPGEPKPEPIPAPDLTNNASKKLADQIIASPKIKDARSVAERINAARSMAGTWAKGKDAVTRALGLAQASGAALWSALSAPPKITAYKQVKSQWNLARQLADMDAKAIEVAGRKRFKDVAIEEAMYNWLEADGDPNILRQWADGSKGARKRGYDRALAMTPEEIEIAKSFQQFFDAKGKLGQAAGILDQLRDHYVTHLYQKEHALARAILGEYAVQKLSTFFRFSMPREIPNMFEAEKKGMKPVTKKVSQVAAIYSQSFDHVMSDRAFVRGLFDAKSSDGKPLVKIAGYGRPDSEEGVEPTTIFVSSHGGGDLWKEGYRPLDHPALRKWKVAATTEDGQRIFVQGDAWVHPEIYQDLKNTLGKSNLYEFPFVGGVTKLQGEVKGLLFSFSPFHLIQEGTHAIGHRVNPANIVKIDMENTDQRNLVRWGLNVIDYRGMEQFVEGLGGQGVATKIPVIGPGVVEPMTGWLFQDYIPRLKMTTALHMLSRNRKRYPNLTAEQLYELTASHANYAYGELNYRYMGSNPTFRHALQLFFLAPDFLRARAGFSAQALTKYGAEQLSAWLILTATIMATSFIVSQLTGGTWDPKRPFSVKIGNREYNIRSVPPDIWDLFSDTRRFAYGRVAPLIKSLVQLLSGYDYRGKQVGWTETAADLATTAIPSILCRKEDVSYWESFLGSVGLKIKRTNPFTELHVKADEFNAQRGQPRFAGALPQSKYRDLKFALDDADIPRARTEVFKLLDSETAKYQARGVRNPAEARQLAGESIVQGLTQSLQRPLTGSVTSDYQFLRQYPEEKSQYLDERRARARELAIFRHLVSNEKSVEK